MGWIDLEEEVQDLFDGQALDPEPVYLLWKERFLARQKNRFQKPKPRKARVPKPRAPRKRYPAKKRGPRTRTAEQKEAQKKYYRAAYLRNKAAGTPQKRPSTEVTRARKRAAYARKIALTKGIQASS